RGSELRGPKAAARFRFPKTGIVPAVLILCGGIWWWLSRTPDSVYRRTPGMREPPIVGPVIRRGSSAWPIAVENSPLPQEIGIRPDHSLLPCEDPTDLWPSGRALSKSRSGKKDPFFIPTADSTAKGAMDGLLSNPTRSR